MPFMPAVLGPSTRLANFRLAYLPAGLRPIRETRVLIWVDGILVVGRVHRRSVTVHDALNADPNTCQFVIESPAPAVGQTIRLMLNSNAPRLLFSGFVQTVDETFIGRPTYIAFTVHGIDDSPQGQRRLPFGSWTNESASTVATALVARFVPGFTAQHVQAGLPAISISLDGSEGINGALNQIAKLIGGYWYWEDRDLHLFTEELVEPPDPVDATHPFLYDPPITAKQDDSQIRTRVYGKGFGEETLSEVDYTESSIPIRDAVMFNSSGGRTISETQQFTYSGVSRGGPGSVVGTGATPASYPAVAFVPSGTGMGIGLYMYAYSFVTASGESLAGPKVAITTKVGVPNPTAPLTYWYSAPGPGGPLAGGFRGAAYTFVTASGETAIGPFFGPYGPYGAGGEYAYPTLPIGPAGTIARKFYRTPGMPTLAACTAAALKLCQVINDNTTTNIADTVPDGSLGAAPPASNQTGSSAVAVSAIAKGPAAVTARKLYRTAANGTPLKLLTTLADNVATTWTDTAADVALGADAPLSDTSALSQPSGQVLPGTTVLPVAGTGWIEPGGGWAIIGNGSQAIRYTGASGNTIIGIPASGRGAIVATVNFGSSITAAPMLTGVSGLTSALRKGAPINLWVQRDDLAAQTAAAAREHSDGIHEHRIVDERRGEASLVALCDADLARYSRPIVTVTYATRDVKTKSGKEVEIDLAAPAIHETLMIQDVTITEIDVADGLAPRFTVTASSERYTLEAMLRRLGGLLEGA